MGKIIVSENVSIDGVVQDPTGDEGFRHGGWFNQIGDKDREEWAKVELDEALGAEALLMGRRSDDFFATRWAGRSGEWADRLNNLNGDIVVYASCQLVHTLMEHDLVDELRLMVYPVVLGAGERLFGETSEKKSMRLLNARTVGDGLAFLTYELVRGAKLH